MKVILNDNKSCAPAGLGFLKVIALRRAKALAEGWKTTCSRRRQARRRTRKGISCGRRKGCLPRSNSAQFARPILARQHRAAFASRLAHGGKDVLLCGQTRGQRGLELRCVRHVPESNDGPAALEENCRKDNPGGAAKRLPQPQGVTQAQSPYCSSSPQATRL